MYAKYKMKTGEIVTCFLWEDMLDSDKHFLRTNETYTVNNKEEHLDILFDENTHKKYFIYKGEKKYFDDFEYPHYEDLLKDIKSYPDNEILACFLKESEKICIVNKTNKVDTILPFVGLSMCDGEKTVNTIMIPKEDGKYKKSNWHYKIEFTNIFETMNNFCSSCTYYFSDFCDLLKSGVIKLEEKDSFLTSVETFRDTYIAQVQKENSNIFLKLIANIKRKINKYNYKEKVVTVPCIEDFDGVDKITIKHNIGLLVDFNGVWIPVTKLGG